MVFPCIVFAHWLYIGFGGCNQWGEVCPTVLKSHKIMST